MSYRDLLIGDFVLRFEEQIISRSSHRIINGKAPKCYKEAFKEGEEIGRESQKKLSVEILKKMLDAEGEVQEK